MAADTTTVLTLDQTEEQAEHWLWFECYACGDFLGVYGPQPFVTTLRRAWDRVHPARCPERKETSR